MSGALGRGRRGLLLSELERPGERHADVFLMRSEVDQDRSVALDPDGPAEAETVVGDAVAWCELLERRSVWA